MGQCQIRNVRMWFKIYHNALMTHQTPYKGHEWPWQRSVLHEYFSSYAVFCALILWQSLVMRFKS